MTIAHLPGTTLTPQVVLARNAEVLDDIAGVVVVIMRKDRTFNADWSRLSAPELCMMARVLDEEVRLLITGASPENEYPDEPRKSG